LPTGVILRLFSGIILEKSEDKITEMEFAKHLSIPRVNSKWSSFLLPSKAKNKRVSNPV